MSNEISKQCLKCGKQINATAFIICDTCLRRMAHSINKYGENSTPEQVHCITPNEIAFAFTYWQFKCATCEREFLFPFRHVENMKYPARYIPALDHVVPLCHGGNTTAANILPICTSCNMSKKQFPLKTWLIKKVGKKFAKRKTKEISDFFKLAAS